MNNIGTLPQLNRFSTDTPSERRSTWSQEEDARLLQLVSVYGPKSWCAIAKEMKTRNGKSCRSRWFNYLAPGIKKGAFTAEEEQRILERQKQFGNRWSAIAEYLPGRTDMAIKNYWNGHLKRKLAMQKHSQPAEESNRVSSLTRMEAQTKDTASGTTEAICHSVDYKQDVEEPVNKRHKTDDSSFNHLQNLGVLQDCKTLPFVVALAAILIELCDEKDPQMLCNVLEIANQIRALKKGGSTSSHSNVNNNGTIVDNNTSTADNEGLKNA